MSDHHYSYQNEIEAKELLKILYQEKKVIFAFVMLSLFLSISYIFIKVPIYKTTVILGKAYNSQLIELNVDDLYKISPSTILASVEESFRNGKYLLDFYKSNKGLFANYLLDKKNIEVNLMEVMSEWEVLNLKAGQKERGVVSFIIKYPKTVEGHKVLNRYIEFILKKEKNFYINELKVIVESKINSIEKRTSASKLAYELRKKASIEALDEAIITARAIGLKKPYGQENEKSSTVLKAQINNQKNPLYYRGYDALEAEKKVLLNRKKDELFIAELVGMKKKLFLLKEVDPLNKKISIVTWVKKAFKQEEKVEPRQVVIVIFSILSGLILSFVFIAVKMLAKKCDKYTHRV